MLLSCNRLVQALSLTPGGIVGDTLQVRVAEVNKRHASLLVERDELQATLEATFVSDEQIKMTLDFRADGEAGFKTRHFKTSDGF